MPPDNNTPGNFDISPAQISDLATSVGSDIFGGEKPSEGTGEGTPPPANTAPAADVTPPPVSRPRPAAWKKEMEAQWDALPPDVQTYLDSREQDVYRGISMYRQGHEAWNKVLSPYQQILSQHPDLDPATVLSNMLQNHFALASGTPEQKRAVAERLFREYNLNPQEFIGSSPVPSGPDPTLVKRLDSVEQVIGAFRQKELAEHTKSVEAFFSDPKNEFAKDLGPDILNLIQSGQAPSLAEAYEKAMWLNPTIRAKVLDKELASRKAKEAAALTATKRVNGIEGNPNVKPHTGKPKTINDTIDAIAAKYTQPH